MRKNKMHPAAELAAYKTGLLKTDSEKEDEEKYLRLAAEFDNFRKRSSKQYSQLVKSANEELILEILEVVDDFKRALGTTASHAPEGIDENHGRIIAGMKLIYEKLLSVLKNRGVREIEALHKPFDPHYHEAVMQLQTEEHEDGTVVEVVSPGYLLEDRVIRHSKVVVAS